MSDKMRQIQFGQLMDSVLYAYEREGTVFGVSKLYKHTSGTGSRLSGHSLELPIGPAAGPHTQLAQNIITAYVSGARFFELKTVQTLDGEDLPVSKPCITANDEGYNVEWSTELYVPQALDEYIKAWYAIKIFSREMELGSPDGFIFNMSVGYDLDGIRSKKIDSFIEGLKNAADTESWNTCRTWSLDNLSRFKHIDSAYIENISAEVSNSITLSTLHGCPPAEIERIAQYLLREKGLHTFVKCNPTLLGYDYARSTLDKLGFDYIGFDDKHFNNDLQFADAVPMLRRLQQSASDLSLDFGVKLTNTFPVKIQNNELPGGEMYMSGRTLFPLSIEVAYRLSGAFDGGLKISFSGGADARNIPAILDTGIYPVTLATTLLKPGGYERLYQIATSVSDTHAQREKIDCGKLAALSAAVFDGGMYKKPPGMIQTTKTDTKLPMLGCYSAPCRSGCPFGQDIPAYLRLMAEDKPLEALRVITQRNPLPFITGTICSHNCMSKCMRRFVDSSVDIRGVKLEAAQSAFKSLLNEIESQAKNMETGKKQGTKAAVIGGGPAGLSVAYFLSRAGYRVTLFEQRDTLGGIVRHVIPGFRIDESAIDNDIRLIKAMGVDIRTGVRITDSGTLRSDGFEHIIAAAGAWNPGSLRLQEGAAVDALEFLEQQKNNPDAAASAENVVVIGGGNTAMDTARAAVRAKGTKRVTVVYRRTRRFMPAAHEEIETALKDGVRFLELASPLCLKDNVLTCELMKLTDPDPDGRRSFAPTGETVCVDCDMLISAIGNVADKRLFEGQDVYVIGDASGGPATVAEAIADAAACAVSITGDEQLFDKYAGLNINACTDGIRDKRGIVYADSCNLSAQERCLECATICNVCVEVCPNRANISVCAQGKPQVVHIDSMCNECGNCAVFCPYDGAPYLDKFTVFDCEQDFEDSKNPGFVMLSSGSVRVRLEETVTEYPDIKNLPVDISALIFDRTILR